MYCKYCLNEVEEHAQFCNKCGNALDGNIISAHKWQFNIFGAGGKKAEFSVTDKFVDINEEQRYSVKNTRINYSDLRRAELKLRISILSIVCFAISLLIFFVIFGGVIELDRATRKLPLLGFMFIIIGIINLLEHDIVFTQTNGSVSTYKLARLNKFKKESAQEMIDMIQEKIQSTQSL